MKPKEHDDQHGPQEAQRRFEKLVRTALNTPPKPMKDMPRKRPASKSGRRSTNEQSSEALARTPPRSASGDPE